MATVRKFSVEMSSLDGDDNVYYTVTYIQKIQLVVLK